MGMSAFLFCCLLPVTCENAQVPVAQVVPGAVALCLSYVFNTFRLVWTIIEFVLRTQVNDECNDTPKGTMVFAWSVVTIIGAVCQIFRTCYFTKELMKSIHANG